MKSVIVASVLSILATTAYSQVTVAVSSSAGVGGLGQFSTNADWDTSGGFTFAVGVFDVGFTPTSLNTNLWLDAWNLAVSTGLNTGTGTWLDDGGSTYFTLSGAYTSNAAPYTIGARMYVWGYNTQTIGSATEWIMLTNPSWLVSSTASPATAFFDTTDVGTVAIIGSVTNSGNDLKSALVAIPEPSSFAALAGLAAVGFAASRRRRSV